MLLETIRDLKVENCIPVWKGVESAAPRVNEDLDCVESHVIDVRRGF